MNTGTGRAALVVRSLVLFAGVVVIGAALAAWKVGAVRGASASAAATSAYEPAEAVTAAIATTREHRDATTSIGTVLAMRSVTLRNEVPGTVREVRLAPGRIVESGELLVGLDVSVERAELEALVAEAELAESTLGRVERMAERQAVSAIELDEARAQRDVAIARIDRTRAVIERKTIRAPFRARVGIADLHPGQFLDVGTLLTTLQGVDDAVHVDFSVGQIVAAGLTAGDLVEVFAGGEGAPAISARIVAIDAQVDPSTRNAMIRARVEDSGGILRPGASVRVRVLVGAGIQAVWVPVGALRKGPAGDHVFALQTADGGETRAQVRPVRAGPVIDGEVVILEGLSSGDSVAVSGSFKLRDGALVQVAGEVNDAIVH